MGEAADQGEVAVDKENAARLGWGWRREKSDGAAVRAGIGDMTVPSSHCIDMTMTAEAMVPWRATFVYGEPKRELGHTF